MQTGRYRAHFTGYRPTVTAAQELCEDTPTIAVIVLDFINLARCGMDVDFRVVADANDAGVSTTFNDLGSAAEIEAATVSFQPHVVYPRVSFNTVLPFISVVCDSHGFLTRPPACASQDVCVDMPLQLTLRGVRGFQSAAVRARLSDSSEEKRHATQS